tara:strand:- start:7024 stop:11472 length:4449 start_codon:yes stop_codon:yes gene_type:complete
MANILPPGAQTFLKASEEAKAKSALLELYEAVMLDYSKGEQLTEFSKDLGFERPPVFFGDDDQWRAIVRAAAFSAKHTRDGIRRVFELILGPITSQVTVLDRTVYATILIGDTLTITGSTLGSNGTVGTPGTYTVKQVRMHELVFEAGTFNKDDTAVVYSIEGTVSTVGKLLSDSQGNDILQDTTVQFVNTHPEDFLSKVNSKIPQYGKVYFNRASTTDEESFTMSFYDKDATGILKIREKTNVPRRFTRNKYMPIQSSFLASDVVAKSTTLSILDATNFPANAVPAPAVTHGSDVLVIKSPAAVAGTYAISSVSGDTMTVAAIGGFTAPVSNVTYSINVDGDLELKGTNVAGTMFGFQTGKVENATTFVDTSKDFSANINASRYSVTIGRGEATEETVEIVSRSGAVLTMAPNTDVFPENSESRLKFKHFAGESVEIADIAYSTTASYYVLDASGNVEGTADSGQITLTDAQASFVTANESTLGSDAGTVVDGDEVEITDTSSGLLGKKVAIKQRNSATQLTLDPGFDTPITGLKYKIRKKYKPTSETSKDNKIYVADARGFPATNFSVILDRGKENEEVVWISTNTMFSGTNVGVFAIANNENGTEVAPIANVAKEHDFGMTVEPAQVLIKSCKWSIIETRANGEFTVAFSAGCVPESEPRGFYLHEAIDSTKFTNAKDTEPSVVLASTMTEAITNESAYVQVSLDDLDDKVRDLTKECPQVIGRSVKIVSSLDASVTDNLFLTEELTLTTLVRGANSSTPGNYPATPGFTEKDTITVADHSNFIDGDVIEISRKGSGTSETATIVSKKSITNTDGTFKTLKLNKSLESPHFIGDTIHRVPAKVGIASASNIASGTSYLVGSKISLIYNEDEFSYPTDLMGAVNQTTNTILLSSTVLVDVSRTFHSALVGQVLMMIDGLNIGEERLITEVRGDGNHQLVVGTAFSNAIGAGDSYKIKTLVQSGDINSLVPNSAGTEQVYNPIYAGSYLFAGKDNLQAEVDQPSHVVASLPSTQIEDGSLSDGTLKNRAVFRIPAPQKLIATPKLSVSQATQLAANIGGNSKTYLNDNNQNFNTLGVVVGDEIEFLGPNTDKNYKKKTVVSEVIDANTLVVSAMDYDILENGHYRIHGKSVGADGKPVVVLAQNSSAPIKLYLDDTSLFPRALQNPFFIQVGDDQFTKERFEVLNINNQEGWIELNTLEAVQHDHLFGEKVALEVKYLCINGDSTKWPSQGAIYLDYGSTGSVLCQTDLFIEGRSATISILADTSRKLVDSRANFQSAYGNENKNALLGYKVIVGVLESTIKEVINDTQLLLSSEVGAGVNVDYTIVSTGLQSLVDNSEPGSRMSLAGGVLTAIDVDNGGSGVDYPAGSPEFVGGNDFKVGGIRHGGAVEEYVEYSAKDGRVLTLKDTEAIGHVFEHAHPSGTKIMLATGQFSTAGDGADYRPYLGGNFLEVILNSNVTNLPELLKAAGIEFKAEQTELGC